MFPSLSRRISRPVIAAAAAVGLVTGVAAGTATADPATSYTATPNLTFTRSVVGPATVHPGDTVSYKTTLTYVTTPEKWVTQIYDYPPATPTVAPLQSATTTYTDVTNRASAAQQSNGSVLIKCTGGCSALGSGFVVKSGQPVTVETTYTVPSSTPPGTYQSGFTFCNYKVGGGCDTYGGSALDVNVVVVAPDVATTATLTAPATATIGQSVTLTATVAPSNATGTVQFKDGGTDIGSPVAVSGGVATLNHTFTTAGSHDISAAFTAGSGFTGSVTTTQTVAVSQMGTTTSLSAPATAFTDEAVDLTATVAPADATGTVQFKDGTTDLGAPVTLNGGSATLSHAFTTTGNHAVTAVYSGDATHAGSTSSVSAVDVSVKVVDSTTTLTAPATATIGTAVDLTATVDPAAATGTVEFTDGTTSLGTATVVNGVATLSHTFTTDGTHSITAAYAGDATHAASTSAAATVEVSVAIVDTTTTLNVPATATTGTAVDLTATVAPADATGTVEFTDGTTSLGTATLSGGTATLSHTFTTDGTHSITAVYSGAEGFATSSSSAGSIEVSTDPVVVDTTTTLNVPADATTGQSVDLWALVGTTDSTGAVGGTVQFQDNGTDIGGAIALVDGGAKLAHTFTSAGTHSITAVYSGAEGYNGSTGQAQTVTVTDPAPGEVGTVTTLEAPTAATTGEAVTLTATVKTENGDNVTTGTVRFMDGTTPIGEAVDVVDGKAVLSYTFGETGSRQITAVYTGSTGFTESTSAAATVTVTAADTSGGGSGSTGSLENIFGS